MMDTVILVGSARARMIKRNREGIISINVVDNLEPGKIAKFLANIL